MRRGLVIPLVTALVLGFGAEARTAEVQVHEPEEAPIKIDIQDEEQGREQE